MRTLCIASFNKEYGLKAMGFKKPSTDVFMVKMHKKAEAIVTDEELNSDTLEDLGALSVEAVFANAKTGDKIAKLRKQNKEALKYFKTSKRSFINFILLDLNGNAILDSENGILNNVTMDRNDEGWKKFVSSGYNSGGEASVSKSVATGNPTYRVWAGIKDNTGRVIGVLSGNVDWSDLINGYILNVKIGETGKISIIDGNKKILAHNDNARILTTAGNNIPYDEVFKNKNGIMHYKDSSDNQKYLMSYYNVDNPLLLVCVVS